MAWMNVDKNKILSAAIYTSEDPYMGPAAHLVSDILNIEPTLMTDMSFYNAFADQEINERHHSKACEENFQIIMSEALLEKDHNCFIQEAIKQNKNLLTGEPVGWCAYALLRAAQAFKNLTESPNTGSEEVHNVFQEALKEVPWWSIRKAARRAAYLRRLEKPATAQDMIEFGQEEENLQVFSETFAFTQTMQGEEQTE